MTKQTDKILRQISTILLETNYQLSQINQKLQEDNKNEHMGTLFKKSTQSIPP